jgi:hypothetical protein
MPKREKLACEKLRVQIRREIEFEMRAKRPAFRGSTRAATEIAVHDTWT